MMNPVYEHEAIIPDIDMSETNGHFTFSSGFTLLQSCKDYFYGIIPTLDSYKWCRNNIFGDWSISIKIETDFHSSITPMGVHVIPIYKFKEQKDFALYSLTWL